MRLSEDVLICVAALSWKGIVHVLAPKGSELGVGYWELHHADAAAVSTGCSNLPEHGLTSQKILACFGVAVSAAASNGHRGI